MTFTTSYRTEGLLDLLTALIKSQKPKIVLEFGTQQGSSAIAIAKGLEGGKLVTYDLFEPNYSEKPYSPTHADKVLASENIRKAGVADKVEIRSGNVFEVWDRFEEVDILHVDLCNYFGNVYPIMEMWNDKVTKMIIFEGGDYNHWQMKLHFSPFHKVLHMPDFAKKWEHTVIRGDDTYCMTVLTRNKYDSNV